MSNLSDVIAIAAGNLHSLALKSDSTVWIWGAYDTYGPLSAHDSSSDRNMPVQVSNLSTLWL